MADDLIPQFQLTPVDYDPFSAAYDYAQKLAKQQSNNELMTHAVGMPAQGPTAEDMAKDPNLSLGVRLAARATEAGPLGWPGALAGVVDKFHQVATGQSYLEPGKAPLTQQELEKLGISTGLNMTLGGMTGDMVPGKLKMGLGGEIPELGEAAGGPIPHEVISPKLYDLYTKHQGDFAYPASNPGLDVPADKPQMADYLAGKSSYLDFAMHPDTTITDLKHPMVAAKEYYESNPNLHLEKVPPQQLTKKWDKNTELDSELEKQLHGLLSEYTTQGTPELGSEGLKIPKGNQLLQDYLSGKISYNEFGNKATQEDFQHPYVNPKLYSEMANDLPSNKAHTLQDIAEAKAGVKKSSSVDPFTGEAWEGKWDLHEDEPYLAGLAPQGPASNSVYTNPEYLANRYSRPATEPPMAREKDPYHVDEWTGEELGPEKYSPHLKPVKWAELKGKSEQNLLTPDMPTYGPAVEQGYNPNVLLHRGMSSPITGEAWWDPSTKPRERGVYAADEPRVSSSYGKYQYPAVGAFDKPMEIDWPTATGRDAYSSSHMPGIVDAAREAGADLLIIRNIEDIVSSGKAKHDQYVVLDPRKLRDPQLAKFDPARKGENNLLASIGGGMVGLPVMKSLLAPTEGENK